MKIISCKFGIKSHTIWFKKVYKVFWKTKIQKTSVCMLINKKHQCFVVLKPYNQFTHPHQGVRRCLVDKKNEAIDKKNIK